MGDGKKFGVGSSERRKSRKMEGKKEPMAD
jgi:hypothetical protein